MSEAPPDPKALLAIGLDSAAHSARPRWTPPAPGDLPAIPNLEVGQLLGSGGMGAVYRARQSHLDRPVALKVIDPARCADPAFAERFAREARTMARLDHPAIVRLYDYGQTGTWPWLVMELIEGANLREVIRTGSLSPAEALRIAPLLCEALAHAHAAGVVHRDLKPENILIDSRGRPHIADFGLAKLADADGTLTATGEGCGTAVYMAPEQVAGAAGVDHRADLYALGVILYEMFTGALPLGRFAPPSQTSGVDKRLDEVVLKSLEREPGKRWQSAAEVQQAVALVAGVQTVTTATATEVPLWVRLGHAGLPTWMVRVMALVYLALFLVGFLLLVTVMVGGVWTDPQALRISLLVMPAAILFFLAWLWYLTAAEWAGRQHRPIPSLGRSWKDRAGMLLYILILFAIHRSSSYLARIWYDHLVDSRRLQTSSAMTSTPVVPAPSPVNASLTGGVLSPVTATASGRFPLATFADHLPAGRQWHIRTRIRWHDVQGQAYLESWQHFADGSACFTRTLAESGPMAAFTGTSTTWRETVLPFDASATTTALTSVELAVVLAGPGTVEVETPALVAGWPH